MQQCRSEPFSVWIARASSTLLLAVVLATFCSPARAVTCDPMLGTYFPPSGEGLEFQKLETPSAVGLDASMIDVLRGKILTGRWALWRRR